jgi:hypothetical protein
MRVGADAAWPLKAHLSEVGWIATWECVERLCGQLAIPATWLVEQETWEPLPCSCYTNSDPISRTPIHLANQVATLQQQLSFVVATASVFPAGLSAKRQLNHQAKLESKISTAFYSCLHSYVDAIRKLSNNPVSGSESSAISTKVPLGCSQFRSNPSCVCRHVSQVCHHCRAGGLRWRGGLVAAAAVHQPPLCPDAAPSKLRRSLDDPPPSSKAATAGHNSSSDKQRACSRGGFSPTQLGGISASRTGDWPTDG